MRDCKGIKIRFMLDFCLSSHKSKDFLPQPEVFWNLRLSHMSFLPFVFAVPVPSTLGFLSLPLLWVFFAWSFHCRSFCQVGLLLYLASISGWGEGRRGEGRG